MTPKLPSVQDFPQLPAGYTYELVFSSIDSTYNERRFTVRVVELSENKTLTEDLNVAEQFLLLSAKDLAKRAHLLLTMDKIARDIRKLNKALRERADKA